MVLGIKSASTPELRRKHGLISWGHIILLFVAPLARSLPSHLFWHGISLWAALHILLRIYAYVLVRQDRKKTEANQQGTSEQKDLENRTRLG